MTTDTRNGYAACASLSKEDLVHLLALVLGDVVPPSGVEPELPEEPDFESGASTNSAKGATALVITGFCPTRKAVDTLSAITLPFDTWSLGLNTILESKDGSDVQFRQRIRILCGPTRCNVTGEMLEGWNGRWWYLSEHMTSGEIVQTVFKACMTAIEHEMREMFKYKGAAVLDPHYDMDALAEWRSNPTSIKGRDNG